MSSTCNIAGCHNDKRLKMKQIVMPHVAKLQMHAPHEEHFAAWQAKLEFKSDSYCVTKHTRACSNHFKNGFYNKEFHPVPTLYLRGYPKWAKSKEDLRKMCAAVDDAIINHILTDLFPYTSHCTREMIMSTLAIGTLSSSSEASIQSGISKADKNTIRDFLTYNFHLFPPGKVQEVIAKYDSGIEFKESLIEFQESSMCSNIRHDVGNNDSNEIIEDSCNDIKIENVDIKIENVDSEYESACFPHSTPAFHDYCKNISNITFESNSRSCTKTNEHTCGSVICNKEKDYLKSKLEFEQKKIEKLQAEIKILQETIVTLKTTNTELQDKVSQSSINNAVLDVENIFQSDYLVNLHTGLPNHETFNWLYDKIKDNASQISYRDTSNKKDDHTKKHKEPERLLSKKTELLLSIVKLKLNLPEKYISYLFGVSSSSVSQIISTWIPFLGRQLKALIQWPAAEELSSCDPKCVKKWENMSAIIDCFEVPIEKPSHIDANINLFSNYANRPTVKFLLACTPGGSVSYISPPAVGSTSDVELFNDTELVKKSKPGEACLADKGFRIEGSQLEHGVPPTKKQKQFTKEKNYLNEGVAHSRIHVERVIGKVRDYEILNAILPSTQKDLVGPAAVVCCALTNLKESVVRPHH